MLNPARSHGRALSFCLRPPAHLSPTSASTSTSTSNLGAGTRVTSSARHSSVEQQKRWSTLFSDTKVDGRSLRTAISGLCRTAHPLSNELKATGVWIGGARAKPGPKKATVEDTAKTKGPPRAKGQRGKGAPKPKGDRTRINIVSPDLVKDIIDYIKPTLKRHEGCDLISVYPGAGLWSSALHDAVKPRSHLLLEPDTELYRPMLQPLLGKDGVQMIAKSGIVWEELDEILTPEFFPHQKEVGRAFDQPPPRNDTLLVDVNLSMYPKRKFHLFDSISRMVLYQLLSSLRNSALYQKYGQVRMLIWIPDDEKAQLLPRVLNHRIRMAMEGELFTEYIAEVCGLDTSADLQGKSNSRQPTVFTEADEGDKPDSLKRGSSGWNTKRFGQLDLESVRQTIIRMQQAGIKTPPGRETLHLEKFKKLGRSLDEPFDLTEDIQFYTRQTEAELEVLEAEDRKKPFELNDPKAKRMIRLRTYAKAIAREHERTVEIAKEHEEIMKLYIRAAELPAGAEHDTEREALTKEARRLEEDFNYKMTRLANYKIDSVMSARENLHLVRQPAGLGPVMSWDRRPYEPLKLKEATDFFPNVACALLDVQPKAPAPVLRSIGPGSDKSGDMFDLMMGSMLAQRRRLVADMLDVTWPGARDGLLPDCPSLTDPRRGGVPIRGPGGLTVRTLNQAQLLEIIEAFMKWPFRPTWEEMVGRLASDTFEDSGSFGAGNDDAMGNVTLDSF